VGQLFGICQEISFELCIMVSEFAIKLSKTNIPGCKPINLKEISSFQEMVHFSSKKL